MTHWHVTRREKVGYIYMCVCVYRGVYVTHMFAYTHKNTHTHFETSVGLLKIVAPLDGLFTPHFFRAVAPLLLHPGCIKAHAAQYSFHIADEKHT